MNRISKFLLWCVYLLNIGLICLLFDFAHEVIDSCNTVLAYWGATPMCDPLPYQILCSALITLILLSTGVSIYQFIKNKYRPAFLWALSPLSILGLFLIILQFML